MFASLKNKIREETGSDISKLTSKLTNSTLLRQDTNREKHSRQGSTSSINSLVSTDGIREDTSSNDFKCEEDTKKHLAKLEAEFYKKLEDKENEWRDKLQQQEKHVKQLESEKENILKINIELREQLSVAEGYKQKLMEYQEDKEQLENFQIQEIAKVKHLVLLREQELAERTAALKDCTQQIEKLKAEVNRLRRQEQLLSDVQDDLESLRHSSARDLAAIASELARSEEERRHLNDLVAVLRQRSESSSESTENNQLLAERKILEQRLEEAHLHLADIKTSWCEKISSLETQVGRLSRQAAEEGAERRRAVEEKELLSEKVKQMECEIECNKLELSNKDSKINRLIREIEDLTSDMRASKSESDEEITFLREQIEKSNCDSIELQSKLAKSIIQMENVQKELKTMQEDQDNEYTKNKDLQSLILKLEKELNEERAQCLDIQKELNKESSERNAALLRNAEISQQVEIVKQESRHKENEISELLGKVQHLEGTLKEMKELEIKANTENDLRSHIADLEEQLVEKNKNIKSLQMRLNDMKKALQQELRAPGQSFENLELNNPVAVISPSQSTTKNLHTTNSHKDEDDINFKYLKHVIIKFLTSREYEAQHLTRAVATLLKFSPEEEKLLHDTLAWKMSWFGTRPNLGMGQMAKAIPPS